MPVSILQLKRLPTALRQYRYPLSLRDKWTQLIEMQMQDSGIFHKKRILTGARHLKLGLG